ncbi:MAG: potassium channel family protein [Actinobacteria bacterium]|nr:potassium channel family protein [Actinomycetota bacterium]
MPLHKFHRPELVLTPAQAARMQSYSRFGNPFALIMSLIFLVTWVIDLIPTITPEGFSFARLFFWLAWLALVIDYFIRVFLSGHPLVYIIRNPFGFLGAILPPFRLFYIVHAFSVLSGNRPGMLAQASIGAVVVLFISIVLGSALVVHYEYGQPGATIETYDDAIWWAFETVSTVGYGDFVPVTQPGRVVAIGLMVVGVALASVAAASVISFLSGERKKRLNDSAPIIEAAPTTKSTTPADNQDLFKRLDALEAKLDQLISRSRQ